MCSFFPPQLSQLPRRVWYVLLINSLFVAASFLLELKKRLFNLLFRLTSLVIKRVSPGPMGTSEVFPVVF